MHVADRRGEEQREHDAVQQDPGRARGLGCLIEPIYSGERRQVVDGDAARRVVDRQRRRVKRGPERGEEDPQIRDDYADKQPQVGG